MTTSATTGRTGTEEDRVMYQGFQRMFPYISTGLLFLTTVYYGLYFSLDGSNSTWIGTKFPSPDPNHCLVSLSDNNCTRSDLFAFQITSGIAIWICGWYGLYGWHISPTRFKIIPQTSAGRLFGYIPSGEYIAAVCFTFQFWDLLISFTIPEHRTVIMICHHIAASLLCFLSLRYNVLNYYGIFFLGCSEISSIFLVIIDMAKFFPPIKDTLYEVIVYKIAAPGFVVSFIINRFLLWWPVSYQLYCDVYEVTQRTDQATKLRPGCTWVLYIFVILNIPLGILQLYWLTVIVEEVQKELL